ncbi:hypothetical protein FDT66_06325 [Polaribacter aestuariivivens]|uniref:Transporter n=1 Tax=Polaribacter aestuariivivens TaxID=2304626 RepID=A0A5S3N768_9FLAO|nr:hypothetical protein [Polaribacter aestuariivivens]TMM30374.1 hypothetical protein FDT66_06325 [Polaribacter aestuariivivens]
MKKISTILLLLLTTSIFSQSPWTKEKGDLFINFSYTTISDYNELFGDPDYNTERNITDRTYQIYGEYGFTNKTSLVFSVPLKSIKTGEASNLLTGFANTQSGTETTFGNIQLGLKHQFYNNGWVLTGQLLSEINTSSYDDATGIRTGYDAFTFTPQFLAGKSFGKTFLQTHIGADLRTNNYSSNFKIGGEFGGKITQNIWLIGYIDVVKSFENGDVNIPTNNMLTGLYVNDQEYGAYGLKGILQLCDLGLTVGFGNAFFGNNVAKQTAFSIGIFNTF